LGPVIEQQRYHQRQLFMTLLKMAVHGGHAVAQQAESRRLIRSGLMFNPSSFKLQVRWPHSLTPVTDVSQLLGIHSFAAFLHLEIYRV